MSDVRSIAEAKSHLSEMVARVGREHERITLTVHGRPVSVLLALAVLSDTASLRALSESDAELARSEGEDEATLAAAMRARRDTAWVMGDMSSSSLQPPDGT